MRGPDELDALRGRVLDGALLRPGDDVLDLGDGSGLLAADVRGRIGDGWVYAIARDVGTLEELLRSAHELGIAGVAYLVGDVDVLPLPDASVDVVVGRGPFAGVEVATGAARELHRVLRPGGRLSLVAEGELDDSVSPLRDAGFLDVDVAAMPGPAAASGPRSLVTARKP
jgi:ubiquinone/menaquinone biosynthesis C-methylase UbiE